MHVLGLHPALLNQKLWEWAYLAPCGLISLPCDSDAYWSLRITHLSSHQNVKQIFRNSLSSISNIGFLLISLHWFCTLGLTKELKFQNAVLSLTSNAFTELVLLQDFCIQLNPVGPRNTLVIWGGGNNVTSQFLKNSIFSQRREILGIQRYSGVTLIGFVCKALLDQ